VAIAFFTVRRGELPAGAHAMAGASRALLNKRD